MGIFDIFNNSAQTNAANQQISGINAGLNQLGTSYGQGRDALNTNYASALAPYTANYAQAKGGTNMLGNALGLNGVAGGKAALTAFQQADPSFAFGLQQGDNSILANAAATGGLGGGAEKLALQSYGQDYGNQQYGNWINQLMPYMGASNAAAGGIAGVDTGLGSALNQNYSNLGNAQFGGQTSIGNANANAALGNLTGSANLWGLGTNLLKTATGMGGFGGGGGGLFGGFGGSGGGSGGTGTG